MKKALMLLSLVAAAAGTAHAGTYSIMQDASCPLVTAGELTLAIDQAARSTNLDLPRDMAVRGELHCTAQRGGHAFSFRASIEKQVADGDHLRWAPVAYVTSFGKAGNRAALLKQVSFTVGDVIRQEP
jgi:hypothetical protein